MQIPARIEPNESCGTPLRICPILQPPEVTAPKPINRPPVKVIISVPGDGARSLNSPAMTEAIIDPRIVPMINIPNQLIAGLSSTPNNLIKILLCHPSQFIKPFAILYGSLFI